MLRWSRSTYLYNVYITKGVMLGACRRADQRRCLCCKGARRACRTVLHGATLGAVTTPWFHAVSYCQPGLSVLLTAPLPLLSDVQMVQGKTGLCGFTSTNLPFILSHNGIKNVALAGFLTNCCVESTMRAAYEAGFNVITLTDCCAATRCELLSGCAACVMRRHRACCREALAGGCYCSSLVAGCNGCICCYMFPGWHARV